MTSVSDIVGFVLLFGLPILNTIWFFIALILFLRTSKEDRYKRNERRILMFAALSTAIMLWLAVAGLVKLLSKPIVFM